jgi:hypothetical protein
MMLRTIVAILMNFLLMSSVMNNVVILVGAYFWIASYFGCRLFLDCYFGCRTIANYILVAQLYGFEKYFEYLAAELWQHFF